MESIWNILMEVGTACLQLIAQPFYYIALLLVILQFRRQIVLERKLFHARLHYMGSGTIRAALWGLLLGIPASLFMLGLGSVMTLSGVLWLWGITLLLGLFRVRWMCYAYAAGTLGILHSIAVIIERGNHAMHPWLQNTIESLAQLHLPSILALAAVMHLVEAVLVRWQGTQLAMPLFWESKRGKVIGGYQLQGFWPVPLLLMVPMTGDGGLSLPWTPLFGGELWTSGWTVLGFPLLIGTSSMTFTRYPEEKARRSAGHLLGYGVIVLAVAIAVEWISWLLLPASILCIALHELILWISRAEENARSPLYVHDRKGLRILGVIPGSPASQLGINPGEIIHRINGIGVLTKEQLHQAFRTNPAFIRLELFDRNGEKRFLQRAMYAGEHHQLGIILAPDDETQYVLGRDETSLLHWIWMKMSGVLRRSDRSMDEFDEISSGAGATGVGAGNGASSEG